MITYCQTCRSGMIARRTVGGSLTQFRVSGQLWQPPREYTQASLDQEQITGVAERDGESADVFSSENPVLVDGDRELLEPVTRTGDLWTADGHPLDTCAGDDHHLGRVAANSSRRRGAGSAVPFWNRRMSGWAGLSWFSERIPPFP